MKKYILICISFVLFFLAMFKIFYSPIDNAKTNQYEDDIAQLLQESGIDYVEKDDYENAKEYLLRALEKNKSSEKKSLSWCGLTYLYLARNARYHNKWEEAEKYYEKSAELLENSLQFLKSYGFKKTELAKAEENAFVALCIAYKWLQKCFYKNKTQIKALKIYPKIEKLKKQYKNSIYIADIYPGLISNFMDSKKYKESLDLANEAISIYKSIPQKSKNQDQIATLWWLKANIFHLTGKSEKAIRSGETACAILKVYPKNSKRVTKISAILKEWKKSSPND